MGNWTNTATFAKFYYKPVRKLTFSKAVQRDPAFKKVDVWAIVELNSKITSQEHLYLHLEP